MLSEVLAALQSHPAPVYSRQYHFRHSVTHRLRMYQEYVFRRLLTARPFGIPVRLEASLVVSVLMYLSYDL